MKENTVIKVSHVNISQGIDCTHQIQNSFEVHELVLATALSYLPDVAFGMVG